MATVYDAKTGEPVELPEEHVQAALLSGKYGLPKGAMVPVQTGGTFGRVPIEKLTDALKVPDTRVVPQAQVDEAQRKADLQKKYGGALQGLAAGAQGFASSASLGLSDLAAGKLLSPEQLAAYKAREEANPISHGVGSAFGIAVPAGIDLATGGAATPELLAAKGA